MTSTAHFLTLAVLFCLVSLSWQESCTSNLYAETETSVPSIGQCPVAWVNSDNKCNLFSTMYSSKRTTTTCISTKDCLFGSLDCYNQKCTPRFRLIGDSCVSDDQCLAVRMPTYNIGQSYGPKCINGKCAYYGYQQSRRVGEPCQLEDSTSGKTFFDCNGDGICYGTGLIGKCVQKVVVQKGNSCYNSDLLNKFLICDSGLYCKYSSLTTATCVERVQYGQPCTKSALDANYVPCASELVCRQNSNSDTSTSCKRISTYGEFCISSLDCAYTSSDMVECIDNKCRRVYGTSLGGVCKKDSECYSGYCSTEGKCADPSALKCSDTASCPTGSSCACGGKPISSTSGGKCAATCLGAFYDVRACIYNLGVTPSSAMVGTGTSQYVDEDSSLFTRCRYTYNKFYSCMRKSWIDAGIPTKGEMEGINLNAYSVSDSATLPERNTAQSNHMIGMLAFVVFFLIALLF